MCGIAGLVGSAWDSPKFDRLLQLLARRGPDDQGLWREPGVALGHRRLSIIDLSPRGRNPMLNEDGSVVLVFNGEIFNYRGLRSELVEKGHRFQSDSDAEVLLHLYEDEGTELCRRLEGMYAFALWDRHRKRLFAARDPFGEKPFYYGCFGGHRSLVFASSATALVSSGLVPAAIEPRPIARYLLFGACVGSQTPIRGLEALPPGTTLEYSPSNGSVTLRPQRRVQSFASDHAATDADAPELAWQDIRAAVQRRMIADVPVGVFLSGGIDSTTVAAALRELVSGRLMSFSVGYESEHTEFDETADARHAARWLGTEHYAEIVTAEDFARSLDDIAKATDLPSHDGVNTFFASRLAARHVKVTMTGIGGDELFGGYSTFRYEQAATSRRLMPLRLLGSSTAALLRPFIQRTEERGLTSWPLLLLEQSRRGHDDTLYRWFQVRRFTPLHSVRTLLAPTPEVREETGNDEWAPMRDRLKKLFDLPENLARSLPVIESVGYMSPVLLRDSDAMSMYHSLELRVPFLDSDLVRLALSYSLSTLVGSEGGKRPLRQAVQGHIPDRCLQKRKQGFGVPMGAWLWTSAVRQAVCERFREPPRLSRDIFETTALQSLIKSYYGRPKSRTRYRLSARVWMTYTLLRWLETIGSTS